MWISPIYYHDKLKFDIIGNETEAVSMDPYEKKLSEMKGYVPFLDKMISRLEKVKDGTKDQQLSKMKDLLKVSC